MATEEYTLQPSTIETIDRAIYDLINNKLDLHTSSNTGFKKVPVLWISPERAFNVKDKEIRDSVGKLKLPLITIERSSMSKDPKFKGAYQANIFPDATGARGYKKHQRVVSRRIAQKPTRKFASADAYRAVGQNHYPTDNKKVVYEQLFLPIPVWINAGYSITLRTEYQQQMNDLLTPFMTRPGNINTLIAKYEGHEYTVFIQETFDNGNNVANLSEEERSFKSTVKLKVLGYLLGDGVNEDAPKAVKKETVVEVKLIRERTIVGDSKPWESDNKKYRDI